MASVPQKISIALATYNGERYVEEQLRSLAEQSRPPDELVVSDDASTDATVSLVEQFAATAPFTVKVLPAAERLGYAGNFNRALEATTGDLVFLCDQDDSWFPEKLAVMSAEATAHPEAMVLMNDVRIVHADLSDAGITKLQQFAAAGIGVDRYVMGAAAVIRREFLEALLPIPPTYPAHDDWIVKPAIGMKRRHLHAVPLQRYRMHESNTSQFRVNSARRVSRFSVVRSRLDGLVSGRSLEIAPVDLAMLEQELAGAERAAASAEGRLADDFTGLASRLAVRKAVLERRLALRARPRLGRLADVGGLLRDGSYAQFHGVKSALADLLSPVIDRDAPGA